MYYLGERKLIFSLTDFLMKTLGRRRGGNVSLLIVLSFFLGGYRYIYIIYVKKMKIGEVYVSCITTDWMLVDVGTGCILSSRIFFFGGGCVLIVRLSIILHFCIILREKNES